jgi:serine/threonine-protein kinase HipA
VAKRISDFVSTRNLGAAREQFALMVAYACAIENGDAHLKNFSVLYSSPDAPIELAPAYDVISTTPYAPNDTLALTLAGTKTFPDRGTLVAFVRSTTGKNERSAGKIIDQAIAGARHAIEYAKAFATDSPEAQQLCKVLEKNIGRGIARLR